LSSQSAKDSVDPNEVNRLYELFLSELLATSTNTTSSTSTTTTTTTTPSTTDTKIEKKTLEEEEEIQRELTNKKLIALTKAGTTVLQVFTAEQALGQLLSSPRIWGDLVLALCSKTKFQQNLGVRQWIPIDVDMEWRGFVCHGTLTALSQYHHDCYFPRLKEMKDTIGKQILEFFSTKISSKLKSKGFVNYVVDFAVTGKSLDQIYVIDINPWGASTESALFNFKEEENTVLSKGPFEVRIRDGIHPIVQEIFEGLSIRLLNKYL